ncbi:MAG: phosphohistidine phosphatase SixA [Deltaproteobacteria bacterium]|nr:phosphohistidine phosphatase SixA [Deltaproteobacteria bacterium]
MSLFLVQHGKNLPKDVDPEKGLSDEGKNDVKRMAAAARERGVGVSAIKHSGKKRARETADIFAEALDPSKGVQEMEGLAPMDDVTHTDLTGDEDIMLVGHLPFMEKLTTYLIAGSPDRYPVLKFQNGGIVCLNRDTEADAWFIKWTLFPHTD